MLAFLLGGCSQVSGQSEATRAVLLVGNSLTATNDLAAMLEGVSAAAGDDVEASLVAAPNRAVIDHANGATDAVERARSGEWGFVVLQQGPTPPGVCRDTLILGTQAFAPAAGESGARLAVIAPWTRSGAPRSIEWAGESAELAARAVGGVVVPVGAAWRDALENDPALPLYQPDGYHPAPAGTLLAALTLYARLFDADVRTIPTDRLAELVHGAITPAQVAALAAAAQRAAERQPADPREPATPTFTGAAGGEGPC